MVSFATDGAVTVSGGNWQIFDSMVQRSGAALCRNRSVASISFARGTSKLGAPPKYVLATRDAGAEPARAAKVPTAFDKVIIATPWQFSGIYAGEGVLRHRIDEIPYTKLHVTLFASPRKLRPGFYAHQRARLQWSR